MTVTDVPIRSLLGATDVQVLPPESVVEDQGTHIVVRTPTNPGFFWGNFLLVRDATTFGDCERWERAHRDAFPECRHVTVALDEPLPLHEEFGGPLAQWEARGYERDLAVALVATPDTLRSHPRASDTVFIDPIDLDDVGAIAEAIAVRQANRDSSHSEATYQTYLERQFADLARLCAAPGVRGGWFLARAGDEHDHRAVAGCGVIVVDGRARFQSVDTISEWRRRGVASRLVHDVARWAIDVGGASRLVIGADVHYHAAGLYESLGFVPTERGAAALWHPDGPNAANHPGFAHAAR